MALTEIPIELSSTPSIVDGGNATAITIDSSENVTFAGNVGIGTGVAPGINGSGLAIFDALYPRLTFRNNITGDSSAATVGTSAYLIGDNFYLNNQEAGILSFGTATAERMHIDASGNVIVGTTSSTYPKGKFTIHVTPGVPATSGTSTTNVGFRLGTTSGNSQVLDMGVYNASPYGSWIQTSGAGEMSDTSPLVLNPNGGNVGIGQAPSTFSNWKILEIKGGTAGAMLNFENSSSTRVSSLAYDDGSDSLRIQNFLANPITFETSNTERMRVDSLGRVTTPYQPSFQARLNANQAGFNSSGSFGSAVGYNVTDHNVGNHFSTSTGLFTAPVAGLYFFEAATYLNVNAFQSWYVKNSGRVNTTDKFVAGTDPRFPDNSTILLLAVGDSVGFHPYVLSNTNVTVINNANHTYFKGYLIG